MMRRFCTLVLALLLVIAGASAGHAIPHLISYQGILTDDVGDPITSTTSVEFRLWDTDTGGNELWMETQLVTPDADGLFEILLGDVMAIPDSVFDADSAFLGVSLPPDAEMTPRTRMVAIAYAYRVGTVDGASGGTITSEVTIGTNNTNTGTDGFVAGDSNTVSDARSVVSGGVGNEATGVSCAVSGGSYNKAQVFGSSVGGGNHNTAYGLLTNVSGGESNDAIGGHSTIGGGFGNYSGGEESVIAGGSGNRTEYDQGTICGGTNNYTGSEAASIVGGYDNQANGSSSFIGGGAGNETYGEGSMVPGGAYNVASGDYTWAAGYQANAYGSGCFMWADSQDELFEAYDDDQFLVRAQGGVWLGDGSSPSLDPGDFLGTSTGGHLTFGGDWTNSSDVHKKENFTKLDRDALLEKIAALPITEWNYKTQGPSVKHIGPMAQDFRALFDLGGDDVSISTIDPAGIALAAIQELTARNDQLAHENQQLRDDFADLKALVAQLAAQQ